MASTNHSFDSEMDDPNRCQTVFTHEEARRLETMDSTEFGCLNLVHPEKIFERRLVIKALKFYEQRLEEIQRSTDAAVETDNRFLCEVLLKLGHLNLLIHDFVKALSAYQRFYECKAEYWKDAPFLYGLGLVYFHFNIHKSATEVFQRLLYLFPNFCKAAEVNIRLGLAFKALHSFDLAIKNLRLAFVDPNPTIFSKAEIRFHIAHCIELKGDLKKAHSEYQSLLQSSQVVSPVLRASLLRQLGWLFFREESFGDKAHRISVAINCLQQSLKADPTSGRSHYYLGRCFSTAGRAHEAFLSYRHSIDKNESNADIWCSIGVLYQQQQQPFDALQAFVCAIQLDDSLSPAWIDLGLLYEQYFQLNDALKCYKNALKLKSKINQALFDRIEFLETQLKGRTKASVDGENSKSAPLLPNIEDVSRLPIPAQLLDRQNGYQRQRIDMYLKGSLIGIGLNESEDGALPSLNSQQIQMMHILSQNQALLNPHQMLTLRQLQETHALTQHFQQQREQQRDEEDNVSRSQETVNVDPITSTEIGMRTSPLSDLPQVTQEDLQAFLGFTDQEDLTNSCLEPDNRNKARIDKNDPIIPTNMLFSTPVTIQDSVNSDRPAFLAEPPPSCLSLTAPLNVPCSISSNEIFQICKQRNLGRCKSVYEENVLPPQPPTCNRNLPKDRLLLTTPCTVVDTKKDASSLELQRFCYQQPIVVIRGLTSALKMDLSLFSTKTIVAEAANQQVELRTQYLQASDVNVDSQGNVTWQCGSQPSYTTVGKYAAYQLQSFQNALKDDKEKMKREGDVECNSSKRKKDVALKKVVKFGTNVDLSDERKWHLQLKELNKLPSFCRVYSSCNLLSHLGHVVLGMNTVQLYMKVPGARTPGHQENNNFAGVNINIGPGECEWFAVPYEYWDAVKTICENNKCDFLRGSWWPSLEDLYENNIPLYRFTQKAGDVVWIGEGTVHWVHSTGWCNNIAWNVGPLTASQYQLAVERYEFNKLNSYKSLVPLIHLSWQLARNIRFSDKTLFEMVRKTLIQSIAYCQMVLDYVCERLRKELKHHPRIEGENSHYCCVCEVEVFNILFVLPHEDKYIVYCLNCALKHEMDLKSFYVLNQYNMDELAAVLDQFTLVGILFCLFNNWLSPYLEENWNDIVTWPQHSPFSKVLLLICPIGTEDIGCRWRLILDEIDPTSRYLLAAWSTQAKRYTDDTFVLLHLKLMSLGRGSANSGYYHCAAILLFFTALFFAASAQKSVSIKSLKSGVLPDGVKVNRLRVGGIGEVVNRCFLRCRNCVVTNVVAVERQLFLSEAACLHRCLQAKYASGERCTAVLYMRYFSVCDLYTPTGLTPSTAKRVRFIGYNYYELDPDCGVNDQMPLLRLSQKLFQDASVLPSIDGRCPNTTRVIFERFDATQSKASHYISQSCSSEEECLTHCQNFRAIDDSLIFCYSADFVPEAKLCRLNLGPGIDVVRHSQNHVMHRNSSVIHFRSICIQDRAASYCREGAAIDRASNKILVLDPHLRQVPEQASSFENCLERCLISKEIADFTCLSAMYIPLDLEFNCILNEGSHVTHPEHFYDSSTLPSEYASFDDCLASTWGNRIGYNLKRFINPMQIWKLKTVCQDQLSIVWGEINDINGDENDDGLDEGNLNGYMVDVFSKHYKKKKR
ncbi:Lysine-specific demethylase 6A [Trichinella nelsoni]|uniref:Lysine-specific demethylase 6A n=1 Tax=Trichinella nelsoni TaxID=6336 RepID=A0A0V0S5G1_9BILA|nr:Lysine-specific demethylase 6A [Trichinella nelsoni]